MSTACLVVAAGSGVRLGADVPKAFVEVAGASLLQHAATRVLASGVVDALVAVVPAGWEATAAGVLPGTAVVVAGGATRQESVAAGLAALPDDVDVVLVHDAARGLAPAELVAAVVAQVRAGHPVVVPGVAVHDTVRSVDRDGVAGAVVDRSLLRAVQTPQGFSRAVLDAAHASPASRAATDDAGLAEAAGHRVHVVDGSDEAFKVTRPLDLLLAGALLARDERVAP